MDQMPTKISSFPLRRLSASDAEAFRELRLEGLKNHPNAFGSSWEEEAEKPLAWFVEQLEQNIIVAGSTESGQLVGIAALGFHRALKQRHKGVLWGMYVRPRARGSGLAAALVEHLLDKARGMIEEVHLTVVASNEAAIRLYTYYGFRKYGLERRALKVGERYYDELWMACSIKRH
ncbi:GNAT family N-acetyltransferase [Mesorhizobium sp. LSHC414A00]|uniref:GNAT family N-acetyltransferase n=1 Tax=Mesorhizobium sp. LSHC414A00 TaxID=1287287 RepID=UPI0003CEA099|nr:GNAT family N-acetyltransferase [Mesorhizobium sp. LSHC414A00]ESX71678.1 acetyltransferase [Mesorhizobium sp. LSHC414A00]